MINAILNVIRCLFSLTILLNVFGMFNLAHADHSIRICIPNQTIQPFYIIDKRKVSGTAIEHLRLLFRQPALAEEHIKFVREPWQRCLKSIEESEVDLIIAGHSEDRANVTVFPDAMGESLASSAFSFAQICFVKKDIEPWTWTGKKFTTSRRLILGLEPGFLIPTSHRLNAIKLNIPIWDTRKKYDLIKLGRVDLVLTVCGVMDQKMIPDSNRISSDLTVVYPPYIDSPVYLTFSKAFYKKQPELAKLIVKTSNQLSKKEIRRVISK